MSTGNMTTSETPDASRTALIIGATSSMAQVLCRDLAQRGYALVLAGRDEAELKMLSQDIRTRAQTPCRTVKLDLTDDTLDINKLFNSIGEIDDLYIAAGDMGGDDLDDITNIAHTIRVNYTLPAQLATVAAIRMSTKTTSGNKGRIVIISSVAGDRGRQSNYAYGSAKAAITAFASGLRNRYARKGIHVMTVKPGFIDTPMTWSMNSPLIASREYVAKHIVDSAEKEKDVVYVPFFWRYIMLIITSIPERIFKKLSL
jgi:decaprenylphospho-beta-D-erythro-pentofuranosid-2-ulose 2-reductase